MASYDLHRASCRAFQAAIAASAGSVAELHKLMEHDMLYLAYTRAFDRETPSKPGQWGTWDRREVESSLRTIANERARQAQEALNTAE